MKLLIETDAVGGVWTFSLDLALGLRNLGIDSELAVVGEQMPAHRQRQVDAAGLTMHRWRGELEWQPGALGALQDDPCAVWLAGLAEARSVDRVQTCSYRHAASWLLDVPVVLTMHSDVRTWWRAIKGCDPPGPYDVYTCCVADALERAEALVSPTFAFAQQMGEAYGFDAKDVRVVMNGRHEPSLFRQTPASDRLTAVAVGRLDDEAKNLATLLRAAPTCGTPFLLVGPMDDARCELPEGVRCLGELSERRVRSVLGRCGLFVSAARYEPFGLSALEAAQAGCALLLSDLPTRREVWASSAQYVPVDDAWAWSEAIRGYFDQPADQRRSASHDATTRARLFTAERMATRYAELYHSLARHPADAAPVLQGGV